jgi:hypothetical protein
MAVFPGPVCAQEEIVNGKVRFVVQSTSLSRAPVPGGPAGVYTINALLTNTSQHDIHAPIKAVVTTLTNGNLLLSATESNAGAVKQAISTGDNNKLSPSETVAVKFDIGLANGNSFSFFVDVTGAQ